jgi:cytochrome c-type biogenesis protein CcmE
MDEHVDEVPVARKRSGRVKFLAGGVVVVAIVVYLVVTSIQGATAEYLNVQQVQAQANLDRIVRVSGTIVGDTINWDSQTMDLRFELSDDTGRLPVYYNGLRPDMFRDGATAIVEGKVGTDGVFQASQLLLKCPSKYEEKATEQATSQ